MEEKNLGITDVKGAKKNISDLEVFGNGDTFKLICKASSKSQGWMKSTKAMQVGDSVVIQVSTQQQNVDFTYSVAEALTTVYDARIVDDLDDTGKVIGRSIIPFNIVADDE